MQNMLKLIIVFICMPFCMHGMDSSNRKVTAAVSIILYNELAFNGILTTKNRPWRSVISDFMELLDQPNIVTRYTAIEKDMRWVEDAYAIPSDKYGNVPSPNSGGDKCSIE